MHKRKTQYKYYSTEQPHSMAVLEKNNDELEWVE